MCKLTDNSSHVLELLENRGNYRFSSPALEEQWKTVEKPADWPTLLKNSGKQWNRGDSLVRSLEEQWKTVKMSPEPADSSHLILGH